MIQSVFMTSRFHHRRGEQGYVLLFLLLMLALLAVGMLEVAKHDLQYIKLQVQRDREEELIHRGVQYSRAVRRFYKKFGRYPTRIEELESTNNIRFLRKRYKDPVTGKDFKPLHLTDVQMSFGSTPNGRVAVADMTQAPGASGNDSASGATQTPSADQADNSAAGQANSGNVPPPPQPLSQPLGPNGTPQVFGGGAIVGVASISKDKTIREFNHKSHYNQWQFIYDPASDRGGLLMTPNQPPLQGAAQNAQNNGQNNGQQNGSVFGQNPGLNNMPMAPQQPAQNPPQQQ